MSNILTRLVQHWDRYWFTPVSLTRLAIYRTWVYAIILIDVLVWTRGHLRYADVDPQLYHPIYFLNFFNIPEPTHPWLDLIYGALAVCVFLAMIGFKTNFFALLASGLYMYWVAQWFSFGWVHLLHPPLLLSMIVPGLSPSGARLSVDHLLKRLRENHAAQQFIPKVNETSPYAAWPLRFVQTIIILLYFLASYAKLKISGLEWANGTTLQWYLMNDYLTFGAPEGLWLAYPVFFNFLKIGTWIRSKITAPRGLTKFAVLFDGQCPLCVRSVTTVDFLDWRGKFVFRDANDWEQISRDYPGLDQQKSLEEMQVMIPRDGGHEALAGFYAFRKIAQHLPLGMLIWPFMYIPGVPFIGTRVYHFIASRRKRVTGSARCSFHTCEVPLPAKNV